MDHSIDVPKRVSYIIERLISAGYSAYAVGGCVRDSIMGKVPSDWDICTSALPQQTLEVLGKPNLVENGMKHGTVTVRYDDENYEITTFRSDGVYDDNRHPRQVSFVSDLREDLARRDLTINALAYNQRDGLVDLFGGAEDIEKGIIRCVGNPDERFSEDGLRIMRTLRFASVLGFDIDEETALSVHKNAHLLKNISAERIASEFNKLLMGKNAERVLSEYYDVIAVFIPELLPMVGFEQKTPHHVYDVWEHTVKVISFSPEDRILRLTAFFHDIGKPECFTVSPDGTGHFHGHPDVSERIAADVLRRLKYDNKTINTVCLLVRLHDKRPPAEPKYVRRFLSELGEELFPELLKLKRADAMGQSEFRRKEKLEYISELRRLYDEELKKGSAYSLGMLRINGRDIMSLGVRDGRQVGMILRKMLDFVIDGELENDRERLLACAKELALSDNAGI